jgi:hypothetical protein
MTRPLPGGTLRSVAFDRRREAVPKSLADARDELEKLALMEVAAEDREARIRAFLRRMVDDFGFEPALLARKLGISETSVESLISTSKPMPAAERIDISSRSLAELLDRP